ncbi:MAG TPA: insulinase family protein [Aquifex aeolicus]|uniref:Insulinase family protein n=1 Tax=Aquifex aeolicus TaxID=63363 RepID=A0A9D0YQP1_AQUAO|nr:insulinase family protein [Aquifex aeolicus]
MADGVVKKSDLVVRHYKNGLWVVIKPRKDTQVVSLQVWFKVGSVYEREKERGIAHFLEHMLFNGNDKYAYGEAEALIESLGGQINAATSKEYTYYYINIASPYWKEGLDVLFHLTMRATLEEKMIEKEKPIVLEELYRAKDNPLTLLWWGFEKEVYKVSPFRHPIIGYEQTIKNFTRDLLLEFYRSFYQPRNAAVVIVGNIDPKEVLEFIENTFVSEPSRPVPKRVIPEEPPQLKVRSKTLKDPRIGPDKCYSVIGWRIPPLATLEDYDILVLNEILSGGRTSLLYKKLRERGIVYGVNSYDFERSRDNIFVIFASMHPQNLELYKRELFKLLQELYDKLTQEELEKYKKRLINSEIFEKEEVENEASFYGYSLTVAGKLNYALYFFENIKKVEVKHIKQVLEKYILKKPYSEVTLLPS